MTLERQRAGGRRHAVAGVDVVLEQHGDAVQRTARARTPALTVELGGDRRGVGVDLEDRPQGRSAAVDGVDAREVVQGDLDGARGAALHQLLPLRDRALGLLHGYLQDDERAVGDVQRGRASLAPRRATRARFVRVVTRISAKRGAGAVRGGRPEPKAPGAGRSRWRLTRVARAPSL
jgi:hypothetical protein